MAAIILEGDSLGKRHQHFNKIVKAAIEQNSTKPANINPQDNDIDNLFKITIASKNKDVDYILEVLKSEDMLYVSTVIKLCTWLITDPQYRHIVNPEYLNTHLFPQMISKASNKLMLHIRLNLRDEKRVESFYDYYKDKNLQFALKWLPYCSVSFIEKETETHCSEILNDYKMQLFQRLARRSFKVLEICVKNIDYYKRTMLKLTLNFLNTHTDKYLDILENTDEYNWPDLDAKHTDLIMKNCSTRILNNFEKYATKIDLATFAKHLKQDDIKPFLSKQSDNKKMQQWLRFDNLKHFVKRLPVKGRFEFLKKVFIEKEHLTKDRGDNAIEYQSMKCSMDCSDGPNSTSTANIYKWYRFAPFETAFVDLKKLIRAESSPSERISILTVLLSCAGKNMQHVQTVLQYYHDRHMNEPFKFKIKFVNVVLSKTPTHAYDVKTWNILNNIFCSLEVYMESDNNVQSCIEAIIVYKVLHNEKIPEIIEKKLTQNSINVFKTNEKKYSKDESETVFKYFYDFLVVKIQKEIVANETQLSGVIILLREVLSLLKERKKELADYPLVLNKIKELVKINKDKDWKVNLLPLFEVNKSWKKLMFEESILINPSEEACLNALKHNSDLLVRYKSEIEAMSRDDSVSLRRLMRKLRVYWPQSLASEWTAFYLARLDQTGGHKALAQGLCTLLPQKSLADIMKKYAPTDSKINWSEDNELIFSLRKQLAKNVHLARPLPPLDVVTLYAQGDYLQFALPSLNSILYNISSERSRQYIPKFLNAPVSLQKHSIRLAFTKLKTDELKHIFTDIWKSTKNPTIREVLFKKTFELLCREKNPAHIEEIWALLSTFIDNLSSEENKSIYVTLGQVDLVPVIVRPKFCIKSYKYLKALPPKANCSSIVEKVERYTVTIMEHLDADFVGEILLENYEKKFTKKSYELVTLLSSYLLCAKSEECQTQRYEKVFVPILESALASWNVKIEDKYYARRNVKESLKQICSYFLKYVLEKNMVFPVKMFTDILNRLDEKLSFHVNYILLREWKLAVTYVKLLEECNELITTIRKNLPPSKKENQWYYGKDEKWNEVLIKVSAEFSKACLSYLKEDIDMHFPSICFVFAEALEKMFEDFEIHELPLFKTLKCMLERDDFIEGYLTVLYVFAEQHVNEDDLVKEQKEIHKILYSHPSLEVKVHCYKKLAYMDDV